MQRLALYSFLLVQSIAFGQTIKTHLFDTAYFNPEKYTYLEKDPLKSTHDWRFRVHRTIKPNKNDFFKIFTDSTYRFIVAKGRIKKGNINGKWVYYHPSGNQKKVVKYKKDMRFMYIKQYHTNGELHSINRFKNGKRHGAQFFILKNCDPVHDAQLMVRRVPYKNNLKNGKSITYYPNKKTKSIYKFKNDTTINTGIYKHKKYGLLKKEYFTSGKLTHTELYKETSPHNTYSFSVNGNNSKEEIDSIIDMLPQLKNLENVGVGFYRQDLYATMDSLLIKLKRKKSLTNFQFGYYSSTSLPEYFYSYKNLEDLTLYLNKEQTISSAIVNLKKLKRITIWGSKEQIETCIPYLSKIKSLREIIFATKEELPNNIDLLKQIKCLYIPLSSDSVYLPESIFTLTQLNTIQLEYHLLSRYTLELQIKMPNTAVKYYPAECFIPNTQVNTPSGQKSIQNLNVGDLVMAFDTLTQSVDTATVTKLHHHQEKPSQIVTIKFKDETLRTLHTTPNHPFWGGKSWELAGTLKANDTLYFLENNQIKAAEVKSVDTNMYSTALYNISTTKKNYFVAGILVHNK